MVSAFVRSSMTFENHQITPSRTEQSKNRFRGLPTIPPSPNRRDAIPWLGGNSSLRYRIASQKERESFAGGSLNTVRTGKLDGVGRKNDRNLHGQPRGTRDPTNMIVTTEIIGMKDSGETSFPMSQLSEDSASLSHSSRLHQRSLGSSSSTHTPRVQQSAFGTPARSSATRIGGGRLNTPAYGARRTRSSSLLSISTSPSELKSNTLGIRRRETQTRYCQLFPPTKDLKPNGYSLNDKLSVSLDNANCAEATRSMPLAKGREEELGSKTGVAKVVEPTLAKSVEELTANLHRDAEIAFNKLQDGLSCKACELQENVRHDIATRKKEAKEHLEKLEDVARTRHTNLLAEMLSKIKSEANLKIEELQSEFKVQQEKAKEVISELRTRTERENEESLYRSTQRIRKICDEFETTYFQRMKRKLLDECLPLLKKQVGSLGSSVSSMMRKSSTIPSSVSSFVEGVGSVLSLSLPNNPPTISVVSPHDPQTTALSSITQESDVSDGECPATTLRQSAPPKSQTDHKKSERTERKKRRSSSVFGAPSRSSKRQKGLPPSPTHLPVAASRKTGDMISYLSKTPARSHSQSMKNRRPPRIECRSKPCRRKVCMTPPPAKVAHSSSDDKFPNKSGAKLRRSGVTRNRNSTSSAKRVDHSRELVGEAVPNRPVGSCPGKRVKTTAPKSVSSAHYQRKGPAKRSRVPGMNKIRKRAKLSGERSQLASVPKLDDTFSFSFV